MSMLLVTEKALTGFLSRFHWAHVWSPPAAAVGGLSTPLPSDLAVHGVQLLKLACETLLHIIFDPRLEMQRGAGSKAFRQSALSQAFCR